MKGKLTSKANRNSGSGESAQAGPARDYTAVLPMFDLDEAIKLATTIREKALENAALPQIAKGCGYSAPTSTPFFRRLQAARLFKLLSSPKAELTTLALDYLKPDRDDAKQSALTKAIMGIPAYADHVQKNVGKKLNTELLGNSFEKSFNLTKSGSSLCARVFVSSVKFAGFIGTDGILSIPDGGIASDKTTPSPPPPPKHETQEEIPDDDSQSQTLYLDNKRKRKITIKAPLTVTKEELERIRAWLGFQLLVQEEETPAPSPTE